MCAGRPARRGFALPMALLIAVVGVLTVSVILQRQAMAQRFVAAQTARYQEHHHAAGVREMLGSWLNSPGSNIGDRLGTLDPDTGSLAFTLELPGDGYVRVWMRDAQGAVLRDPRGSGGPSETLGILAAVRLEQILAQMPEPAVAELTDDWFRRYGPITVSVNSAPEEVLRAVCSAAVPNPTEASRLVASLLDERRNEPIKQADLRRIISESRVFGAEATTILQLLTASPELWEVVVETRRPRTPITAQSEWSRGLAIVATRTVGLQQRSTTIVQWESIPDPRSTDPRL